MRKIPDVELVAPEPKVKVEALVFAPKPPNPAVLVLVPNPPKPVVLLVVPNPPKDDGVVLAVPKPEKSPPPVLVDVAGAANEKPVVAVVFAPNPPNPPPKIHKIDSMVI